MFEEGVACEGGGVPTGLLSYLDSDTKVPEKEKDMIHTRDNLKMVTVKSLRRGVACEGGRVPTGLLSYLDSDAKVPEKEKDMIHTRDNLKMAQVSVWGGG